MNDVLAAWRPCWMQQAWWMEFCESILFTTVVFFDGCLSIQSLYPCLVFDLSSSLRNPVVWPAELSLDVNSHVQFVTEPITM